MPRRKTRGKELLGKMASMSAEVVAHLRGADGSDAAVRISADDAAISADALAGTEFARSVKAKPRHNEDGNPKVCSLSLTKLNRIGDTWKNLSFPDKRNSDVDCTAENDDGDILKMQVTRATRSESFWRGIGKGHVMRNVQSEKYRHAKPKERNRPEKSSVTRIAEEEAPSRSRRDRNAGSGIHPGSQFLSRLSRKVGEKSRAFGS